MPYLPTVFVSNDNPAAPDGEPAILYDTDSGEVFYDVDGVGVPLRNGSLCSTTSRWC